MEQPTRSVSVSRQHKRKTSLVRDIFHKSPSSTVMPSLLDLPSEVLTPIPVISYSPDNAEDAIFTSTRWREECEPIEALSRTCRQLHSIFNPILYQSLILTAPPPSRRDQLIQTLISHPELGEHLRNLGLDLYAASWSRHAGDNSVIGRICNDLHPFFSHTRNLRHLVARCTTNEKLVLNVEGLISANVELHTHGYNNTSQAILKQLLLAPNLRELILTGDAIPRGRLLQDMEPATSNVSDLNIDMRDISAEMLQTLLRLPSRLTSFRFACAWFNPTRRDIRYADIETAIAPHKRSLKEICIFLPDDRFAVTLYYPVFGDLSFRECTSLTWLQVAPEMFLGWKLCSDGEEYPFERPADLPPNTVREPITFVDCLPDQIEELVLVVEPYQRRRNGDDYMYDVLRGVIEAHRLQRLRSIYLASYADLGGTAYCAMCFVSALQAGEVPSILDSDRMDQIAEMCEAANIDFGIDKELQQTRDNPPGAEDSSESDT